MQGSVATRPQGTFLSVRQDVRPNDRGTRLTTCDSRLMVRDPVALRGTEIAGLYATRIDDNLLQDDAGVDHPKLQRVISRSTRIESGCHLAHTIFHRFRPVRDRVVGQGVDNLRWLIVERHGITQAASGHEIQRWGENCFDIYRSGFE